MDVIKYYDEEKEELKEIPIDKFVKETSWSLPYDFVKQEADNNEEIKGVLYHQLLKRSVVEPFISTIKESSYYHTLYQEVIKGNNEYEKFLLATYYDNNLIGTLYDGVDNLIDQAINYDQKDAFPTDLISIIVEASKFDIDDSCKDKILNGIDYLVEKEIDYLDEISSKYNLPTLSEENKEYTRTNLKTSYKRKVESSSKHR